MKNYSIPSKDSELLKFALRGKTQAVADRAGYGFSADDVNKIAGAVDDYETAYQEHKEMQNKARIARQKKDLARKKLKKMLGSYIRWMRSKNDLPAAKLAAFGVQPSDKTRTPVKAPETAPQFEISYANCWHIIRFWEEGSPRRRRKPEGVIGAEIYVNFGGARDDWDNYKLTTLAVGSRYIFKYEAGDVGKQVHYYLVWLTRRGDRSEMSRIESATIAT